MPRRIAAVAKSLTARDAAILTDLARCRVLSVQQIKSAYWNSAKERTCRERLEQLEKAGFIRHQVAQGEKPGIKLDVYHLTKAGKKWATGPEGPGLDRSIVFSSAGKSSEICHQVRTNDVYFTLSQHERSTWRIGDAIEIEKGVHHFGGGDVAIPDASYETEDGDEIYVETDCGSYTGKQIESKVASFEGHKSLWVCPSGRDKTLIKHGVSGKIRMYLAA
jgi:DNA-binding Lrp family transcriptional regulator